MAGSMREKGTGAWELRVYAGRDSRGRVRHRHHTFHGTRRAAERELARMVALQEESPAPISDQPRVWGASTTINDAIAAWKENGWQDLSPKTVWGYESMWSAHIEKSIGRERIASLGTYEVEKYLRKLKDSGLSRASVGKIRGVLHRACRLARKWSGGTLPNPVADAELPIWTLQERGPGQRSPTGEEVLALLKAADRIEPRLGAFVRLIAATGMRRGEACGLRWSDIDWEDATVRIDESIVEAKGGAYVKSPKTRASIRRVAVDNGTLTRLRELHTDQRYLAEIAELDLGDDGFVFSVEPGGTTPPYPSSLTHNFTKVRDVAGVASDIHLHSLRHYQATVLDPVISEKQKQSRLGWSTTQMARHYTDAIGSEDRRAAEHLGTLLGD